jgi:hypothetical protein
MSNDREVTNKIAVCCTRRREFRMSMMIFEPVPVMTASEEE